eukprot:COSAG01_NODE_2338_length_7873_cov_25.961538_7_plen_69_part_00
MRPTLALAPPSHTNGKRARVGPDTSPSAGISPLLLSQHAPTTVGCQALRLSLGRPQQLRSPAAAAMDC